MPAFLWPWQGEPAADSGRDDAHAGHSETCQWGLFLRNHDEVTWEMVTELQRLTLCTPTPPISRCAEPGDTPAPGPLIDNDPAAHRAAGQYPPHHARNADYLLWRRDWHGK